MSSSASLPDYETALNSLRRFMDDSYNMTVLRKFLGENSCQITGCVLTDQEVISQVAHKVAQGQFFLGRKKVVQYGGGGATPSVKEVVEPEPKKWDKTEYIKQFLREHEIEHSAPPEENWIELEYLYSDGKGVEGAQYRVINNDDGSVVARGRLDNNGYARRTLPLSVNNVSYNFSKDPETVVYLKEPVANPELAKVKQGWFDRMANGIAAVGSWSWGTLQGDFNEDPTTSQIVVNTVITMIPVVDQVGDGRDIAANLKLLVWDKRYYDKWVWIALVLTLIGLIPVLGSAAKGVLKTVAKSLKTSGKVPLKQLIEVLNTFHKGHAVKWLRKLAADLPSHASKIKGNLQDILKGLRSRIKSLANILPGSLGKQADELVDSIDKVAKVADNKIDEAVKELQDGLKKSLDEGVVLEQKGVVKGKNVRKQVAEESPPAPKPEPTRVKPTGGGRSGKRTKIDSKNDAATKRSLRRENDAADTLAENGYTVEQNPPPRPNGKKPDYRIEGEYFDCYAPGKNKSPRGIWSEVEGKVSKNQADRIVLNIDDWDGDINALRKQFDDWPVEDLQEVLIVKSGKTFPL